MSEIEVRWTSATTEAWAWGQTDEQFIYTPALSLVGGRYVARSDEYGRGLTLAPLEGTGSIRLTSARPGMVFAGLSATLVGRDGSAVGLAGVGARAEFPVGEYRLGTVFVSLENPARDPRWGYVFSENGRRGAPVWYKVGKGAEVDINPFGAVAPETGLAGDGPRRPGDDLSLWPRLFTGDGLLIVTCDRGTPTTPGTDDGSGAARSR